MEIKICQEMNAADPLHNTHDVIRAPKTCNKMKIN